MFKNKIIIIIFPLLLYQSQLFSKSTSFDEINSKNLSNYFSGIVAFENKDNSIALDFFRSSKILINKHDKYLERLIMTLILEDKVAQAINIIKTQNKNFNFFEAYILLALDSLKRNDIDRAIKILENVPETLQIDRFIKVLEKLKEIDLELSSKNRDFIRKNYSSNEIAKKFKSIYETIQ